MAMRGFHGQFPNGSCALQSVNRSNRFKQTAHSLKTKLHRLNVLLSLEQKLV